MHPVTQTILAVGVLALVGMGGYVLAYGVPTQEPEPTAGDQLKTAMSRADELRCEFLLTRSWKELSNSGKVERTACLSDK